MTAPIVTEYGETFNVHFYYGHGVSGDNHRRPSRPSDFQLWEREAERDDAMRFDTLSDHWQDVVYPVWLSAIRREIRSGAATPDEALRIARGATLADLDRRDFAPSILYGLTSIDDE